MKKLYLVRHGQTLFNKRRKIQGWSDSPLTELGRKQAEFARDYFKEHKIDFTHAYSSTSERASDTLEILTDLDYQRVKGLKEWNFGVFEGESEDLNPDLPYGDFFYHFGGEKEKDFQKRVSDTLFEIMSQENHDSVLVVGHGAMAAQFALYWDEYRLTEPRRERIGNCAILVFQFDDEVFRLEELINHDFSSLEED